MIYATTDHHEGSKVRLLMNKIYRDDPSKNEEVGIGEDFYGPYQQFQVTDVNRSKNPKQRNGYMYIRVHTNLPLSKDMVVTIKDILYVFKKGAYSTFAVTILEKSPTDLTPDIDCGEKSVEL